MLDIDEANSHLVLPEEPQDALYLEIDTVVDVCLATIEDPLRRFDTRLLPSKEIWYAHGNTRLGYDPNCQEGP